MSKNSLQKILVFIFLMASNLVISQHLYTKSILDYPFGGSHTFLYGGITNLPTADNGYVIFSSDSSNLSKFDNCGKIEWTKKIVYQGLHNRITSFENNFYVLDMTRGTPTYFDYFPQVTKIDGSGNVVWSKRYYLPDSPITGPIDIKADEKGEIWLFLEGEDVNTSLGYLSILKLDSAGTILWHRESNHSPSGYISNTSDEGAILVSGNLLIKFDSLGNMEWKHWYASDGQAGTNIIETSYGYIYACNFLDKKIAFRRLGKNGELLQLRQYVSNLYGLPTLFLKPNGNFVSIFNTSNNFTDNTMLLVEFDEDLNIIHQSEIGDNLSSLEYLSRDMCYLTDSTIIVSGQDTNQNLFYTKLNREYESACEANNFLVTLNAQTIGDNIWLLIDRNYNVTSSNAIAQLNDVVFEDTLICDKHPTLNLGRDTSFCENTTIALGNKGKDIFEHYSWSNGEETPSITIFEPGIYSLEAIYDCGEKVLYDTVEVNILPITEVNLGDDISTCLKDSITLEVASCSNDCIKEWSDHSSENELKVDSEGEFWVKVTNEYNCFSSDTIQINCNCHYDMPNIFTPNHDGINDNLLHGLEERSSQFNLMLYNRWGVLISEMNKDDIVFSTDELNDGIYYYQYNSVDYCNQTTNKKGWVKIVR